jgi:dipeptidyl aminopeptidase/acylaminoacyl peptidase
MRWMIVLMGLTLVLVFIPDRAHMSSVVQAPVLWSQLSSLSARAASLLTTRAIVFQSGQGYNGEPSGFYLASADRLKRIGNTIYPGSLRLRRTRELPPWRGEGQLHWISGGQLHWSPDGTKVAFYECTTLSDSELYVMNADGSGLTNVSRHPHPDVTFCDSDFEGGGFDWSPDSKRLVFWSARTPVGLYIVNVDGSGLRYLTAGRWPAWSPINHSIVFVPNSLSEVSNIDPSQGNPSNWEVPIYTVNVDGSSRRVLAFVPCSYSFLESDCVAPRPRWSPDSALLAFSAVPKQPDFLQPEGEQHVNFAVFIMNADGTGLSTLTSCPQDGTSKTGDYFMNWVICQRPLPTAGCEVTVTAPSPQPLALVPPARSSYGEGPGTDQQAIHTLAPGDIACLVGSPAFAEGVQWWPVRTMDGKEGWVTTFDPKEPHKLWLRATGRTCRGEQRE